MSSRRSWTSSRIRKKSSARFASDSARQAGKAAFAARDGAVDLLDRGERHLAGLPAGRRVEDGAAAPRGAGDVRRRRSSGRSRSTGPRSRSPARSGNVVLMGLPPSSAVASMAGQDSVRLARAAISSPACRRNGKEPSHDGRHREQPEGLRPRRLERAGREDRDRLHVHRGADLAPGRLPPLLRHAGGRAPEVDGGRWDRRGHEAGEQVQRHDARRRPEPDRLRALDEPARARDAERRTARRRAARRSPRTTTARS